MRKLLLPALCLLIAACGFHPVYKQYGETTELSQDMRSIDVPVLRGNRAEQIFSTTLADLLDPQASVKVKPYQLELKYKRDEQPAIIQQDRKITRYRLVLTASYTLKDKTSGKKLTEGKVNIRTSYDDLTNNEFANYSAQTDSEQRAAAELAEQVRQRLMGYFSEKK